MTEVYMMGLASMCGLVVVDNAVGSESGMRLTPAPSQRITDGGAGLGLAEASFAHAPAAQRRRRKSRRFRGRSYINIEGLRVPSPRRSRSVPGRCERTVQ